MLNKLKTISNKFILITFVFSLCSATSIYWTSECKNKYQKTSFCNVSKIISMPGTYLLQGWKDSLRIYNHFITTRSFNVRGSHSKSPKETLNRFEKLSPGMNFYYAPNKKAKAGFLLISKFAPNKGEPKIELWDLNHQKLIRNYDIDFESIKRGLNNSNLQKFWSHPFLNPDGSMLLTRVGGWDGSIVKVDKCGKYLSHNSDFKYHHSIEADKDGHIYAPIREATESLDKSLHSEDFIDDGFAILDNNLNILKKYSLLEIYEKEGLLADIYGKNGFNNDPFHLNDVLPYKRDDGTKIVLLSLRNQSSLIAYDLSEEKIIWKIERATMLQHDIDIISEGDQNIDITIFDNNTYDYLEPRSKGNEVVIFRNLPIRVEEGFKLIGDKYEHKKFNIQRISFTEIAKKYQPVTLTAGRSDLIQANKSVMIEESNFGRLVEIDLENKEILWQYVNKKGPNELPFLLSWSRRYETLPFSIKNNFFNKCN